MATFENEILIAKPVQEVYGFLADCNNHEQLMPANVHDWSSTRDEAHFTIQHMAKLALQVVDRVPDAEITIVPKEKPPFDVSLRWKVSPQGDGHTKASLVVDAALNMMMKMVASKPLQQLVDHQVKALAKALG